MYIQKFHRNPLWGIKKIRPEVFFNTFMTVGKKILTQHAKNKCSG